MSEPRDEGEREGTTQRLPVLEEGGGPDPSSDAPGRALRPPAGPAAPPQGGGRGRRGRFWSARRVPAAIVALLVLAVAGVFLYDIASVRAGRPAMQWRRTLADQLAQRPLDDTWVLLGAGVVAALGLWLIVLAATPGLRDVLPMRRTHPDVRAGLHRAAAELVLRDRAMEVAGVQSVRVRMSRTRADVQVRSHFRDLDEVRADLDLVLGDAVGGLGLVRPPRLSVRVRRPGRKG
ncbi:MULTISPECIES: DUF6286 domain-containing protein [unclassified Streptomyces]|uniref:DUF6286 domain-containing protein n=1 Tax=unclassified Streptomyces TaxID=2593676 RepID=UPI001F03572C|nr:MULTISPECIES: DUF6286 domain-containing protein [unclassified Streptomyces]MCH0562602.1 hypothetical protein [Streptomyces sp. MUM 2J]MCH0567888.1 hypothetical protein [Streptomyces sp. MUM 136J]